LMMVMWEVFWGFEVGERMVGVCLMALMMVGFRVCL